MLYHRKEHNACDATMTTTDTPRTDAEIWNVVYHYKNEIVVDADFSRELERELAEANARVDRLRSELKSCIEGNKYYANKIGAWMEHSEKMESEVERLKKALESL